jgi:Spy/CpxP family protein refolding chaperone
MIRRILGSAVVGGALLLSTPHTAFAADTRQAPTPRIEQHQGGFGHGGFGHGGFGHGGEGHGGYNHPRLGGLLPPLV